MNGSRDELLDLKLTEHILPVALLPTSCCTKHWFYQRKGKSSCTSLEFVLLKARLTRRNKDVKGSVCYPCNISLWEWVNTSTQLDLKRMNALHFDLISNISCSMTVKDAAWFCSFWVCYKSVEIMRPTHIQLMLRMCRWPKIKCKDIWDFLLSTSSDTTRHGCRINSSLQKWMNLIMNWRTHYHKVTLGIHLRCHFQTWCEATLPQILTLQNPCSIEAHFPWGCQPFLWEHNVHNPICKREK